MKSILAGQGHERRSVRGIKRFSVLVAIGELFGRIRERGLLPGMRTRTLEELHRCTLSQTLTSRAVRQFETGAHEPRRLTLHAIRRAFEAAGVEFLDENGGGTGVRLRKRLTDKESR
jgi:hypothetical protein